MDGFWRVPTWNILCLTWCPLLVYGNNEHGMGTPIYISGIRISGPQVVYVVPKCGHYKIGCSGNLLRRYGSRQMIEKILHVIVVPDEMHVIDAERAVQNLFPNQCVDGFDIYDLTPDDLKFLKTVRFVEGRIVCGN